MECEPARYACGIIDNTRHTRLKTVRAVWAAMRKTNRFRRIEAALGNLTLRRAWQPLVAASAAPRTPTSWRPDIRR
jgi:hypothetical protein